MSVLIKGGRIVTAADDYVADVYVEDEAVTLIGESLDVQADKVIDASGKMVLPGCIDPHTHLDMPFGGTTSCDDFTSGTVSAAFGGTTCHVDFCIQGKGQTFAEALETWHGKIESAKPVIDVGFHLAVTDLQEGGTLEELARMPDEGVTSYKLFMAYKGAIMVDDETLFRVMQTAADTGALVMVHAEHGDSIDVLVKQALAEGKTDPIWHARTRPPETEGEATNRAVQLAHVAGCALYVVHVSCKESIDPIARAKELGWNAHGETCTQYFFVDETFLERPDFEGAKYVYTPPPRAKENQEHLWRAVATDVLSVISTDHCPFGWADQKSLGKRRLLQDPERRAGDRGPADDDPRVRGARRADLPEPHGRAPRDEPGEVLRPLPAQGHRGRRLRRGHRRLRPGQARDALRRAQPLARRLQPLRGHRGDGRSRGRARARKGDRRERRARRPARRRPLREAGALRRAANRGRGRDRLVKGGAMFGISVGGIIVIVGIVLMFVWSLWIGVIVALIGLLAFGGFARGKWY